MLEDDTDPADHETMGDRLDDGPAEPTDEEPPGPPNEDAEGGVSRLEEMFAAGWGVGAGAAGAIGTAVGWAVGTIVATVVGFAFTLTRLIPKSEAIWNGVMKTGLKGMHRTSGSDIVGIIARANNQLDFKPMKWKPSDPDDPEEHARWATKGDEYWGAGAEGRGFEQVGTVPVALFDEDAEDKGSFLQSRFAEALDLGHKDALFVPENVTVLENRLAVNGHDGEPQAVPDGGAVTGDVEFQKIGEEQYSINPSEWHDRLNDVLVDLGSPDSASGMRVSAAKYKEVYQEQVGSEEMQMQEFRGRAAEADPDKARQEMMKMIKYILAGVVLARSPELLAVLMGTGAGSAMSDLNPLMALPTLLAGVGL